jgi:hypothetical protein
MVGYINDELEAVVAYFALFLEVHRKTKKNLSQDSQYPDRDSNIAPPNTSHPLGGPLIRIKYSSNSPHFSDWGALTLSHTVV